MLCFWEGLAEGLGVLVSQKREDRGLIWRQQSPHPLSVLCSPQPDLRVELHEGEQQSAPEQPAGECWARRKCHASTLGTGSLEQPKDLF